MSQKTIQQNPDKHQDLRGSFVYDGIEVDPLALLDRYAASEHGLFQAEQDPRYSQSYDYQPPRELIVDLGDDVHPVRHMLHTHNAITVPLLAAQRDSPYVPSFSSEEEAELRTAAVLHDIGECTHPKIKAAIGFTVGDAEYSTHKDDDKLKEKLVRGHLFEKYFSDVPPRLLGRVDAIDLKEADDLAVQAFEVIERLGYYVTALRARDIVIAEKPSFDGNNQQAVMRIAQLGRLAAVVAHNHYGFLRSQQDDFPYVKQVLGV